MLDILSDTPYNCSGMKISPHQRTVDALLIETKGIPLFDFIEERREAGEDFKSYERIARDLFDATGGIVDVSYRTVERWHENYTKGAAA